MPMQLNDSVESVPKCVLCDGIDGIPDRRFARLLGLVAPYGVKRCPGCGLRWLSPRPTREAYIDLYSDDHYFGEGDVVERYTELARQRTSYFRERIARIECMLSGRKLAILDVGAATGEFVHEALERGHAAHGIEFSEDARHTALDRYGIELGDHSLEDEAVAAHYDVIHMNHVFEHLPDPKASLAACRRLLKPDGLLVIEVPQQIYNDLERLKKMLGVRKPPAFNAYSLHHTYFYTPNTLTRLLSTNGFAIDYLATANAARTPLSPFSLKNLLLRCFLAISDRMHRGGNIIEVYALPKTSSTA